MNTSDLKAYAPKARKDFIAAVTRKAELLGLNPAHPGTVEQQGDVLLINGQAYPARIANQRARLVTRIAQQGFAVVMEALAYTWFNRLVAIRYMELHGYLDHGYRVLSHPDGGNQPEILEHLVHLELPGLDRQQALEWKAAGNRDEDLYRAVLLAQCHALHTAMPFLFEAIDDATELLLPDGLLRTDSLIRSLVTAIEGTSWQDVEIIGWLYQFYISEKKDEVIGKVVKSEDIPAATQLFTPNWIVKYMVQNSLGAQWLATYPDSGLKAQMAYYIEPAEQTDEVKAQLAEITPASLAPEALTLIDPACGSGHILVEAYELFKAIYLERGYVLRDIPKLVLEKNLYGLDIDERAAQLTGFALMMKARADDRRLFERGVQLNVMALQDSTDFDVELLAQGVKLADYGLKPGDLTALKGVFEQATTYGSLIQVPDTITTTLPALGQLSATTAQDLFAREALALLSVMVRQATLLAGTYDVVTANPPYMGVKHMNSCVKHFATSYYPETKNDLFACFIERGFGLAKGLGHCAMVTMQSWMFLPSFEELRNRLLEQKTIRTMAHLGARAFETISGEVVQTTSFVLTNRRIAAYRPAFFRLLNGGEQDKQTLLSNGMCRFDATTQEDLLAIPRSPIAYWANSADRAAFLNGVALAHVSQPRSGMSTGNAEGFIHYWWEVPATHIGFDERGTSPSKRFYPHNKAGGGRRWFGYNYYVLKYGRQDLSKMEASDGFRHDNRDHYFQPCVSWSKITSSQFAARSYPSGFVFDNAAVGVFSSQGQNILGLLNSSAFRHLVSFISPTLNFTVGDISVAPTPRELPQSQPAADLVAIHQEDWDRSEHSSHFRRAAIMAATSKERSLASSYETLRGAILELLKHTQFLECANNATYAEAYGIQGSVVCDVPIEQITLTVNPAYRYGGKLSEDEQWTRFREDTMQELVSYAIGCMMGRYSLDAPGLIYAHSGNEGFDPSRYSRFPADADGIVPVTDTEWFDDDACTRVVEFLSVAWDKTQLEQNLQFLADNLSPKRGEASRETIRRYLCDRFFKDHLQTYKKRPIYWLFSSGKEQAFQCLVYLHRYNAGTLSRMRMEYVVPLQSRMQARIDKLADDLASASSSAQSKQLQKLKDNTQKKLEELRRFDDKLRHYADQRITLDLDDGVKVNYGKFGDLLADVKAVTGGESDD